MQFNEKAISLVSPEKAMTVIKITRWFPIEHIDDHHESKEIIKNSIQISIGIILKLSITFRVYIGGVPILYSFFSSQSPLSNYIGHSSPNLFYDGRLCLLCSSRSTKAPYKFH